MLAVEVKTKESIYGYRGNKKILFLQITVALQKLIAPARRLVEGGFDCPGYGQLGYHTYESNIDFEVRFLLGNTNSGKEKKLID